MLTLEKTGKFIGFIILSAAILNAHAGYKKRVENFNFYAADKDSQIVDQLADFATQCKIKYDLFFNYKYTEEIDIYLTSSEEEYEKFNQPRVPEWSSGVAYTRLRKIILKPGSYYNPSRYRETLFHEIAHMYIAAVSKGRRVPGWLNEGICMYLSEKKISWEESITVSNALTAGNLIELGAVDSVILFSDAQAELAYLQSYLAVDYLVAKVGEKGVSGIIKDLSSSSSLDDIFQKRFGYSFFEFDIEWYNDLKKRYRWVSLFQFENLFWILLILIICMVFFSIKIRNRKILKEWETEDIINRKE